MALVFYLSEFDTSTTSITPTLGDGTNITALTGQHVTFDVDVSLNKVQANFMYKCDATGITIADATGDGSLLDDISFKTVGNCFANGLGTDATSIIAGACTASTSDLSDNTSNAWFKTNTATSALGNQEYNSVGTEYVLYLAQCIFNDSGAHRYFSNENEIVQEIDVTQVFDDASTKNLAKFIATSGDDDQGYEGVDGAADVGVKSKGMAYKIFKHIIANDPNRLTLGDDTGGTGTDEIVGEAGIWDSIPIKVGDSLQILQTIGAITTLGVTCTARTYQINYNVV
jgi:hypothetical protein